MRTVRLVSLASQKFLSDVVEQARAVQLNRVQAPQKHQQMEGLLSRDKRAVLISEDLTTALQQVRRTFTFAESVDLGIALMYV